MKFTKYNSIENTYRDKYIAILQKYGATYGEWGVSEKIHGSNFSFHMDKEGVRYAKRTSYLKWDDNFFKFQFVAELYSENLKVFYEMVKSLYEITDDTLEVILCGELFGGHYPHKDVPACNDSKKVQDGVFYIPHNDFYAFDCKVNGRYMNVNIFEELMAECGFLYAKSLYVGSFESCMLYDTKFNSTIPKIFNLPELEENLVEGVVIKPMDSRILPNGERIILKKKNESFSERKQVKIRKVVTYTDEENEIIAEMVSYLNDNRIRSAISKLGEITNKDFGKLSGEINRDIIEEFSGTDLNESYQALDKSNRKKINKKLSFEVANTLRGKFLNIIDCVF